jgi:hypothetical protein
VDVAIGRTGPSGVTATTTTSGGVSGDGGITRIAPIATANVEGGSVDVDLPGLEPQVGMASGTNAS